MLELEGKPNFSLKKITEDVIPIQTAHKKLDVDDYFSKLRIFFKGRNLDHVANFIQAPSPPTTSTLPAWGEQVDRFVFDALTLTASDFRFILQSDAKGQYNIYQLMRQLKHVLQPHEVMEEIAILTYKLHFKFASFKFTVLRTMEIAEGSQFPVDKRIVVSTNLRIRIYWFIIQVSYSVCKVCSL